MKIPQEEVFGQVDPIIIVDCDKEANKIANNTKFGLGASIWTPDLNKAER